MITVRINPAGVEDEYLACLNACFPGWGGRQTFDWYFRRKTSWPYPDLITFENGGRLVAGSAVTYRSVALANGHVIGVGIMTGSWTLPDYRRQGFFSKMIDESKQLTARRNGALLLAFVKADNPSCRRLRSAGAALFPTWYLNSTSETQNLAPASAAARISQSDQILKAMIQRRGELTRDSCHFTYPSVEDFRAQFLERPSGSINTFRDDLGNLAVIESAGEVDNMQLFLPVGGGQAFLEGLRTFVASAVNRHRRFFFFSTNPAAAELAEPLGLSCKPGYVAAVVTNSLHLRDALPEGKGADLEEAALLAKPESPWFLGQWQIAGADRT